MVDVDSVTRSGPDRAAIRADKCEGDYVLDDNINFFTEENSDYNVRTSKVKLNPRRRIDSWNRGASDILYICLNLICCMVIIKLWRSAESRWLKVKVFCQVGLLQSVFFSEALTRDLITHLLVWTCVWTGKVVRPVVPFHVVSMVISWFLGITCTQHSIWRNIPWHTGHIGSTITAGNFHGRANIVTTVFVHQAWKSSLVLSWPHVTWCQITGCERHLWAEW